jgi:hypothetical protein
MGRGATKALVEATTTAHIRDPRIETVFMVDWQWQWFGLVWFVVGRYDDDVW